VRAGTTTALVFGAHYPAAVDVLFSEASQRGVRVTAGLVVSDRILRDDLLTTPERAYDEGRALAERWHGSGRLRYAVTPRFSLSCSDVLMDSCGALHKDIDGSWFTSHINENPAEIAAVAELFPDSADYLATYGRYQLVGERSVFAHNLHASAAELAALAQAQASVAHCPTSNSALGSGLFPLREHIESGVRVALGSDVGAGTGFSLLKEGLQAYFVQQLLGEAGLPLTSAHLLYLATASGAASLGLDGQVGEFSIGSEFDAVWLRPVEGSTLDCGLRNADSPDTALAKVFALGTDAEQARRNRRRRRGIADAHLAEDQEIGPAGCRARDCALTGFEGECQLRGGERCFHAEVARAAARLVGDDSCHLLLCQRAGVDDLQA